MEETDTNVDDFCMTTPRRTPRKRKGGPSSLGNSAPADDRRIRLRKAATAAAYGMPYRKAAEAFSFDKMTVYEAAQALLQGDLPEPPPLPDMNVDDFAVTVASWKDRGQVINAYGAWLSGFEGKQPRNTRANIKIAWGEVEQLNGIHDYYIDKKTLMACVRFHEKERKKHRENRLGSRTPYELLSSIKTFTNAGRPTFFPEAVEFALAEWVKALRRGKFKVTRRLVMSKMKAMYKSADAPELWHLVNGINNGRFYRWLRRWNFDTIAQREMDTVRAMWCTSVNMKVHYDCLEEVFTSTEVARAIVGDRGEKATDLQWEHPELVVSIDETRISTNGQNEAHSKTLGQKGGLESDNGECLVYKGSKAGSLMAGMYLDFTAAPTMFVCNSGETFDPKWSQGGLTAKLQMRQQCERPVHGKDFRTVRHGTSTRGCEKAGTRLAYVS